MKTGSGGTFVVAWSGTEIDGVRAAPFASLIVGAVWRRVGEAVRLDGAQGILQLHDPVGQEEARRRAAQAVRRLIGLAIDVADRPEHDDPGSDQSFVLTDGLQSYQADIVQAPGAGGALLVFGGAVPPTDCDLWVVRVTMPARAPAAASAQEGGVICFTPGTALATPAGPRLIESLKAGDLVSTRDNGPQPVIWCGQRRMSGARLHAMPRYRPVRIRSNAFGIGQPDRELVVSPQHRMLIRGPAALALFNTAEVLVAAEHLLNDLSVIIDYQMREVTYVHVLLERHQIVWANGLMTESFHPSHTALDAIDPAQRDALLSVLPSLAHDPLAYGEPARRYLSGGEAAILRHELAS